MIHGDYIRHVETNDSSVNLSSNYTGLIFNPAGVSNGGKLSAGNEACKPNEYY